MQRSVGNQTELSARLTEVNASPRGAFYHSFVRQKAYREVSYHLMQEEARPFHLTSKIQQDSVADRSCISMSPFLSFLLPTHLRLPLD